MTTIVEYTDSKSPSNEYPDRIVSPLQAGPCCFTDMEKVGAPEVEERWRYQYRRCRQCGFTVRAIFRSCRTLGHPRSRSPSAGCSSARRLLRSGDRSAGAGWWVTTKRPLPGSHLLPHSGLSFNSRHPLIFQYQSGSLQVFLDYCSRFR
jgi:hypothetical protein